MTKILLIDNERGFCENLKEELIRAGYSVSVVFDGEDGLFAFHEKKPDLVLIALELPHKDGFTVCREIRAISQVPMILFSARRSVFDTVLGFDLGCDDFMNKPIDVKELLARMKAILRRCENSLSQNKQDDAVRIGNLSISLDSFEALVDGEKVVMPPKELELLYFLAKHKDTVFSRDALLDKVWGFEYLGDSRTVDVHIKRLRSRLMEKAKGWDLATVWGVGYKFKTEDIK